jgi:ComF family protein
MPYTTLFCVCDECNSAIPYASRDYCCDGCGLPLLEDDVGGMCKSCRVLSRMTERGEPCKRILRNYGACVYDFYPKAVVLGLKFRHRADYASTMGLMIAANLRREEYDCVVCVPSTLQRIQKRGYNPAEMIAREVAKYLGLEYINEIVIAKAEVEQKQAASRQERYDLVRDAFEMAEGKRVQRVIERKLKGKNVLLIDDVYTTGATMNSVARVLIDSGVKDVTGATFAVTPLKDN